MALRGPNLTQYQHSNRLTSAPAVEPLTLTLLKEQLRLTTADEDHYLTHLITDARKLLEDATGIAFITQSWRLSLDEWPYHTTAWWSGVRQMAISELYDAKNTRRHVELPRYPLQSITSVTTYDEADNSTAVSTSTVFYTDVASYPGRLCLRQGQVWPTALRMSNAIEILYVAGFGDAASDVPAPCVRAVAALTAYLYQHRGDGCSPAEALAKSGALELVSGYAEARL